MRYLNYLTFLKLPFLSLVFPVFLIFTIPSYSQTEQTLPTEFQNLSIDAKALDKEFQFTLDSSTVGTSQSFVLDKTGFILHLTPSPKIKDNNIKIKIFAVDGSKVQTYKFIDDTIFALVDPQKSYSIYEEIVASCSDLAMTFSFDQSSVICPDTELFKLYENIMLNKDTSYKIVLQKPGEFYSVGLSLPEGTQFLTADKFSNMKVDLGSSDNSGIGIKRTPVNVADLLPLGKLCFVAKKKTSSMTELTNCSLINNNVNSVITFKNSFTAVDASMAVPNILFSFIPGRFNSLLHSYVFEFEEDIKSKNDPVDINGSSVEKYFFENNNSHFSVNLGQIVVVSKKNRKNIFTLNSPVSINKTLNDISFSLPLVKTDALFLLTSSGMTFDVFLNDISFSGSPNVLDVFNLTVGNNIVIKNLLDPVVDKNAKKRFQTSEPDSLIISSYLPDKLSSLIINRDYTFVEQVIAPSVDDKGKPVQIVNNKSKADLVLSKNFSNTDFSDQTTPFIFSVEKPSVLLNNKLFTMQGNLSGFLLPPDFRPVIEDGYRAGITFTMTINLLNDETLKIIYTDLKTKDETALTNFFSFSFLPLGEYDVDLGFDSDRVKLFQNEGVIKPTSK